ncbi:single-stranded DNA-binding protein [bacterium]|nr:single-stranded DNA-binding protein [bacterium]MBT4648899.1 single-stranded DNA-binding protein [bacterium]
MNLNKAMIIGNVVRDPEMRSTPSGQNVSSFSIATNLVWKDQSGQKQEKVEFHNIVAWRRLAEIVGQYLKKGSKVYIEGRLQTRSWDDPSGVKKYRTEIVAENMIMLDKAGSGPSTSDDYSQTAPASNTNQSTPSAPASQSQDENEISVEDIPF